VSALGHHALLGLSVAALGGAGLRAASLAAPRGLERALAAAALAVAAVVIEALALGLIGAGGSAVALGFAAVATWLAAVAMLPRPQLGVARELAAWWRRLTVGQTLLVGAVAGAGAAWTAWLLRYPTLGFDTVLYHLPEAVVWVQDGSAGAIEPVVSGIPVGSYPLAHEVLMSWSVGLARGFVPITLLTPAVALLTAAGAWSCLRGLRVPIVPTGLAVGAVMASPAVIAHARSGPSLDPAALGWLCTCAALCVASPRRPALLAPAIVAGGLAIGTKTTALPLTALALGLALFAGRRHLRRLARPLVLASAAAAVVGLFWYLRNLVQHGSPFWPFLTLPWGDPAPFAIEEAHISFLDRPGETLDRVGDLYLERFAGGVVLIAGALLAAIAVRRKEVLAAAAATLLSVLLWLNAPQTGVSNNPGFDIGTADAVRYLLPGVAAATLALALAARAGATAGAAAAVLLALALVLGLLNTDELGFPGAPSPGTVLAGAAGGALAVLAFALRGRRGPDGAGLVRERGRARLPGGPGLAVAATAAAAALAGALLSPLASGYLARHTEAGLFDQGLVAFFDGRREDERPVSISGALHGLVAGDHLQRSIRMIPQREPCPAVRRRLRRGWVVFSEVVRRRVQADVRRCPMDGPPAYRDHSYRVFAPRAAR
jgi:hypothetical protein